MSVINAIIIEDEKPAARRLQRMLERNDIKVVSLLHSITESVEWLQNQQHPDLIFLDIQLSDGLSFDIFEFVQTQSAIIFTTAYDEYALRAFKLNSIDYLLKPIDEDELEAAIEKFRKSRQPTEKIDLQKLRSLLSLPEKAKKYKSRFTAQVGQHLKLVEVEEIACFYSENKATYLHSFSGRNYPVDDSLEKLEEELDPRHFYRINRKCIINIASVKDILSYTNSRLQLKLEKFDEFPLIVSRERVKDFKSWLNN